MRTLVLVLWASLVALAACTNDYGAFRFDEEPAFPAGAAGAAGAVGSGGSPTGGTGGAAGTAGAGGP